MFRIRCKKVRLGLLADRREKERVLQLPETLCSFAKTDMLLKLAKTY